MKEILVITLLGGVAMLGCSDQAESTSSSRLSSVQSALTNPTHLLVVASYENGNFKAERATRVPGAFIKPRSGKARGALTFIARQGNSPLTLGGLPDPREVHVDSVDPKTGSMSHVSVQATGKQHFVIHLPDTADAVDFYDRKSAAVAAARTTASSASASPAAGTPVGTLTLQGLL